MPETPRLSLRLPQHVRDAAQALADHATASETYRRWWHLKPRAGRVTASEVLIRAAEEGMRRMQGPPRAGRVGVNPDAE